MRGQGAADQIRGRIGGAIIERIAGPRAASRRHPADPSPGEGWFGEDRPIRQVHSDSAMFIGAIRALLLQSLHPLAMAAVAEHSDYRGDPWGRLQGTSHFIGITTFGRAQDAQQAIARVRAIHQRVAGRDRSRRAAVRGVRPAPADLGARGRGRQLPAGPCLLRYPPPG
jgi:uncharacterized protein (DUF2236 family)